MKAIMFAAMHSGAGKTVTCCAVMAALKKRGLAVRACKSGPDYIDPMFHERVLGVESRNLDLFLQGAKGVRHSFARITGDLAVIEGAMGYYDGINGTAEASAWALADCLGLPTVLILRPKGSGVTLAAQVNGLLHFRENSRIRAIVLADCSPRMAGYLTGMLERECALPVLGYLPPMPEAELKSRHLGLLTAGEIRDFAERAERLAEQAEKTLNLDGLLRLAEEEEQTSRRPAQELTFAPRLEKPCCRIAVARDEAFCFRYAENLDALRRAGAELLFFSPIHDARLPEADGLYLCGGYPELHARELAENEAMRRKIHDRVTAGMPTIAECGGFLYMQQGLEDPDGKTWPMCGVLPGQGKKTETLQRFGYLMLEAGEDSLLFRAGERAPAHEFHYWDCTENGAGLKAEKADGRSWRCGFVSETLYAAFPHLHFGGDRPFAERFVKACGKNEDDSSSD